MKSHLLLIITFIMARPIIAAACPTIESIPDFNCDGKVQITVIGDSIVFGIGDAPHHNSGGYVLRAQQHFPRIEFKNQGKLHLRSTNILKEVTDALERGRNDELRDDLIDSDIVIIDAGRNDRWPAGDPYSTFRNLKRISSKIEKNVSKIEGAPPMVVKAAMILPNIGATVPWMNTLNSLILKSSSVKHPADLRFDLVSKRLLSEDRLHPSAAGYDALASTLEKYLVRKAAPRMEKLHPDTDGDGLPDVFEPGRWGLDPLNPDTDGDGKADGTEVFGTDTNPRVPD